MGIYFGTDGLRGEYGKAVTPSITYAIGNSLARLCKGNKKVLIGRDTRTSGSTMALALASGVTAGGVNVIDVGIVTTPLVAYLTSTLGCDYGVMISASHNPKNHNGIKIFDHEGYKINEQDEYKIEQNLIYPKENKYLNLGKYIYKPQLKKLYINHLVSQFGNLSGLKVALDCANGAAFSIAKNIFQKCGAQVYAFNCGSNGKKINVKCGALYPEVISSLTTKFGCDVGFCFDGDADRIIACDEKGNILDGDDILYLLACNYNVDKIVGTSMTNKGLELALSEKGISLLRADVGDKYVSLLMRQQGAFIGGEPCGHIINSHISSTGDGVLSALTIASMTSGCKLSSLCNYYKFPQATININVADKTSILNAQILQNEILKLQNEIENDGRILVRASGTENKIRVMCEHKIAEKSNEIAENLAKIIKNLNKNT
ncbi:MAG: phosphoglucosamine mutase [Clostridia bacterium]|nr:phosphoglucosamine mutase [Clostridia bacterium]